MNKVQSHFLMNDGEHSKSKNQNLTVLCIFFWLGDVRRRRFRKQTNQNQGVLCIFVWLGFIFVQSGLKKMYNIKCDSDFSFFEYSRLIVFCQFLIFFQSSLSEKPKKVE